MYGMLGHAVGGFSLMFLFVALLGAVLTGKHFWGIVTFMAVVLWSMFGR